MFVDTNVDPSLQERQRQLKRARLQDSLSDRLANRPGPLELVEGNILQTDPQLKDALRGTHPAVDLKQIKIKYFYFPHNVSIKE